MKQGRDQLEEFLREQVGFLRSSGAAFDVGDEPEAKRIAAVIRLLVHDPPGKKSKTRSLLRQLRLKDSFFFVDSSHAPPPRGAVQFDFGLAVARMGFDDDPTTYMAPLADRPRRSPRTFSLWWSQAVLSDQEGHRFNRRDLVLGLAHKEGGVHVDPELERAYGALARSNSLGWEHGKGVGDDWTPFGSPVPANVRQIGWELQTTLEEQLAPLVVAPG